MSTTYYVLAIQADVDDIADVEIQPTAYRTKPAAKQALNHLAQVHLADYQTDPEYANDELEIDPDLDTDKDMVGIGGSETGLIETLWLTKITNIN